MQQNKEPRPQDTKVLSRRTFSRLSAWLHYLAPKKSERSEIFNEVALWFLKRLLSKSQWQRKLKRRTLLIQLFWIRITQWRMRSTIIKWRLVTLSSIQLKVESKPYLDNTTIAKWILMNPPQNKVMTKKTSTKIFSISSKGGKVVETSQQLKSSINKQLERILKDTWNRWSSRRICDSAAIARLAIIRILL